MTLSAAEEFRLLFCQPTWEHIVIACAKKPHFMEGTEVRRKPRFFLSRHLLDSWVISDYLYWLIFQDLKVLSKFAREEEWRWSYIYNNIFSAHWRFLSCRQTNILAVLEKWWARCSNSWSSPATRDVIRSQICLINKKWRVGFSSHYGMSHLGNVTVAVIICRLPTPLSKPFFFLPTFGLQIAI